MDSAPLPPSTWQQLHSALASALANIAPRRAAVLGERREVAVLSLHVALYPTSGTEEDPDVNDTPWIDAALQIILAVVHRYAGMIDRFDVNSILVLFGVPFALEDDAERAALAALAIQQALQPLDAQLRYQHNLALALRIGLHIGPVIQGQLSFGEVDYIVVGDTSLQAQRLLRAADLGAIRASPALYERTKAGFIYHVSPPPPGADSEPAYTLLQAAAPAKATARPSARVAMIGRAAELAALCATMDAVIREPQGRVVLISGDAGIGKSRLIAAFAAAIAHTPARCYVLSCSALNRVKPLILAADMLRMLLGVSADLPPDVQRDRFELALRRLQLAAEDLLPYLDLVVGMSRKTPTRSDPLRTLDPMMLQRQTHLALRRIVLGAARITPTVLMLEDLQWIDPASRDFFDYLIQTSSTGHDAHLMIVLVTRDHGPDSAIHSLVTATARHPVGLLDLPLAPLTPAESQTRAGQLLNHPGELLHNLPHQIAARAAGNPLYIEELVRMLAEQGTRATTDELWASGRRVALVLQQLPDTLQGLLAARFSVLPERMRRVLQRAAVLGRSFPLRLLHQLDHGSPVQLITEVDELVARQFLTYATTEADRICSFQHAMLQETVYQTLLLPDRQRLHGQAAQAIERDPRLLDDERAQLLAYHYPESTEPLRALPYLIDTAERSARRYANETAIQHYRRALQLIGEGPYSQGALAAIRIGLGRTLKFNGQYPEAAQILGMAAEALRSAGPGPADLSLHLVEALRELAETDQRAGNLDLAVAVMYEGLALIGEGPTPASRILRRTLIDRLAAVRFRQGDLEGAHRLITDVTAEASLEEDEDPVTLASLYNTLGGVLWQRGDLIQAGESVEHSLNLYRRVNYAWGMATAYTNLGILNHALGRWPQAAEHFQHSDVLRQEIGYLPERAVNLKNLGVLQIEMGRHEQARQSLETSLMISRSISDDYGITIAALQLADLALLQRRVAEARAFLDTAARLLSAAGEDEQILFRWLAGLAEAAEGHHQRALTLVREALELAVAAGVPELEIDCRRVLGALESRRGAFEEADRQMQAALALSIEHGSTFREGLTCYELGWHYFRRTRLQPRDPSDHERARACYYQALERFAALDARHELQRVQAALQILG